MHQKLDKILKQTSNNTLRHLPKKPAFLSISSVEDVENFENDEEYMKLVCKTTKFIIYLRIVLVSYV
jgi:hypothetical protein